MAESEFLEEYSGNSCLLNVHYVPGMDGSQASAIILQDGY